MTSSHLFSGFQLINAQTCAEDVQAAYGLLDSPGEAERGVQLLLADVTSGKEICDAFMVAVGCAEEDVQLKANWILAMLWEQGSHPARTISSTQTPPYTPPPSGYDRAKHKRVWQAMNLSPRPILSEEEFYFAFGVELTTIYDYRITRGLPEGGPRMLVSKMQSLARAAVGLKLIQARLKASPHKVVRKDNRE